MEWRLQTGPVRLGDDTPGVFIRGEDALAYAGRLDDAIDSLAGHPVTALALLELRNILCSLHPTPLRAFERCNRFQCALCGHFSECHAMKECDSTGRCGEIDVCLQFAE